MSIVVAFLIGNESGIESLQIEYEAFKIHHRSYIIPDYGQCISRQINVLSFLPCDGINGQWLYLFM